MLAIETLQVNIDLCCHSCASSFFDDEAGCALANTHILKVCTVSSSQLCLISELTWVEGVCMDQILRVDAAKKLLVFL